MPKAKAKVGDKIQVIADTCSHEYRPGKELLVIGATNHTVQAVGTMWNDRVRNLNHSDYEIIADASTNDDKYVVIYEPYTDVKPVIKTFSDKDEAIEFVDDGDEIDQLHMFLRVAGPVEQLEIIKRAADVKVVKTL